eukprot:c24736_g1_i2 orf=744-2267(-)
MKLIRRLQACFGTSFLVLVISIYWTQGFRSLAWMAISYQLKDELNLSPSASQFVMSTAFMPWSVKPLYGILSDCMPIGGSHRVSYLIISSLLSFFPWLLLGLVQSVRTSYAYLTMLLIIQNFGAAMADVVVDAMMAGATRKERAEFAGDLQSVSWFSMALGGMVGSVAGGFSLSTLGIEGIFLLSSLFPLLQILTCGGVDEKSLVRGASTDDMVNIGNEETVIGADNIKTEVKNIDGLGVPMEAELVKGMHLVQQARVEDSAHNTSPVEEFHAMEDDDWVEIDNYRVEDIVEDPNVILEKPSVELELCPHEIAEHGLKVSSEMNIMASEETSHYKHLDTFYGGLHNRRKNLETTDTREDDVKAPQDNVHKENFIHKIQLTLIALFEAVKQPVILRPMLWFFLAQISIPNLSTIMFYYQTNFLQLDASFLGTSRLVGWGALMLGTFLYNRYLKHAQLRKIFWQVHILLAVITLSDIILVSQLNLWLGIPNKAFVLGASVFGEAASQFK